MADPYLEFKGGTYPLPNPSALPLLTCIVMDIIIQEIIDAIKLGWCVIDLDPPTIPQPIESSFSPEFKDLVLKHLTTILTQTTIDEVKLQLLHIHLLFTEQASQANPAGPTWHTPILTFVPSMPESIRITSLAMHGGKISGFTTTNAPPPSTTCWLGTNI